MVGVAAVGVAGGIVLLGRGMLGYRRATAISDVASSRISSLAVGEVRISGVVEPAELSLVSPLQSASCVYYRSRITEATEHERRVVFQEERAVGFRVRDATGSVRVFPRGARWDAPLRFDERDSVFGPGTGLRVRSGSALQVGEPDRQAQIAALLTVHPGAGLPDELATGTDGSILGGLGGTGGVGGLGRLVRGRRRYEEVRIEIGDDVTIVGMARPFDQLPDPAGADRDSVDGDLTADPEIEADLASARASGMLAATVDDAWGNAAIPGFGIGRPTRPPHLDPEANPEPIADLATSEKIRRVFDIPPEELVVAADPGGTLLIAQGAPGIAETRNLRQFLIGLLGALLAIVAAFVLALELTRS